MKAAVLLSQNKGTASFLGADLRDPPPSIVWGEGSGDAVMVVAAAADGCEWNGAGAMCVADSTSTWDC